MKTVKPIKKAFIAKVLVLCMVFAMLPVMALSASAVDDDDNVYYTVTADTVTNGTVTIYYEILDDAEPHVLDKDTTYYVAPNTKVKVVFKPNTGYHFDNAQSYYTIGQDTTEHRFSTANGAVNEEVTKEINITDDLTIHAVFATATSGGGGGGGGTPVTGPTVTDIFADVPADAWYAEAVKYVYDNGLMAGVGDGEFAPNAVTTRAMVVTVLYRIEGNPSVSGNGGFADVPSGQWYTEVVAWAEAHGIVYGHTDTKFAPNDAMTREQMAAVMFRYALVLRVASATSADLSGYTDAGKVSPWAEEAMEWANAEGVINGTSTTTLSPTSSTIRAQLAQILMNYCENVVK